MTSPDQKPPTNPLIKTLIPAFALSVLGIVLFLVIFSLLSQNDVGQFPSLIIALCVPPAIIAVLIGVYILFGPKRNPDR